MENSEHASSCKGHVRKVARRIFHVFLVFALLVQLFPFQALAAEIWDGSGSTTGSGSGQVSGQFTAFDAAVAHSGYRFSVYNGDGEKLGHSIDVDFQRWQYSQYRAYRDDKQSHIDLYRTYVQYTYGLVDEVLINPTGALRLNWNTTSGDANYYGTYNQTDRVYYKRELYGVDPSKIGGTQDSWLVKNNGENRDWVLGECDAWVDYDVETCFIVVEPLYYVLLDGYSYMFTVAELAVYQSTQTGWDTIPNLYTGTYMNDIGRLTSGIWPRQLYAEQRYSALGTEPVTQDYLSNYTTNGVSVDAIALPGNPYKQGDARWQRNTAADLLKYQVGMAIYTKSPEEHTLTIDPTSGSWTPPEADNDRWVKDEKNNTLSIYLQEGEEITIPNATWDGHAFTEWDISDPEGGSFEGTTWTQGTTSVTLTAQYTEAVGQYEINFWAQNADDDGYSLLDTYSGSLGAGTELYAFDYIEEYFTGSDMFEFAYSMVDGNQDITSGVIKENNTLAIDICYNRKTYVLYVLGEAGISSILCNGDDRGQYAELEFRVGQTVTMDTVVAQGYAWSNWDGTLQGTPSSEKQFMFTMPAEDVGLVAYATENDTPPVSPSMVYTVEHWVQSAGGEYVIYGEPGTAKEGEFVTPEELAEEPFGYQYSHCQVDGDTIRLYYNRIFVRVEHWFQPAKDGADKSEYVCDETESVWIGDVTTPEALQKEYTGFTYDTYEEAEGVIRLYYARNKYKLYLYADTGVTSVIYNGVEHGLEAELSVYFGAEVNLDAVLADKYLWNCWDGYRVIRDQAATFTMPAEPVELVACAKRDPDAQYILTIDPNGGTWMGSSEPTQLGLKPGGTFEVPEPMRDGYVFDGWEIIGDGSLDTGKQIFTQGLGDCTLKAMWKPYFTVNYYLMDANGDYELEDWELLVGEEGESVTPAVREFDWYYVKPTPITVTEAGAEVNYYYARRSFEVSLHAGTGIQAVYGAGEYRYGQTVTISAEAYNGYVWSNWSGTFQATENPYTFVVTEDVDVTALAQLDNDYGPEISAPDRWFALEEAQKGDITMDALMSTATATDSDVGQYTDFAAGEGVFTIIDYSASDFTSFVASGSVTVTYCAIDLAGNTNYLTVTIYIVDTSSSGSPNGGSLIRQEVRFVSFDYYLNQDGTFVDEYKGGFSPFSKWVCDDAYVSLLSATLANHKAGDNWDKKPMYSFTLERDSVETMKSFVEDYGVGSALQEFYDEFILRHIK